MSRRLLPLASDEILFGATANHLCGLSRTQCQDFAEAFTAGDLLGHCHHRGGVAIGQLKTTRVGGSEFAIGPTLHRPGNGRAARDGIHAVHVTQLVGIGDRGQIVDATVVAKGRGGLIFRAAIVGIDLVGAFVNAHDPFATHRATVTGVATLAILFIGLCAVEDGVIHGNAVDLLPTGKDAAGEVEGGQHADSLLDAGRFRCPIFGQAGGVRGGQRLGSFARQFVERALIGHGIGALTILAAHDNRLELFAAHHRAHAGATIGAIAHVHNGSIAHTIFTRRATLGDFNTIVT